MFESLDIHEVLRSTSGSLVREQCVSTDERHFEAIHPVGYPAKPGVFEIEPRHAGHDVDPAWRKADLHDHSRLRKVLHRDSNRFHRGTEANEGRPDAWNVVRVRSNPHVKVSSRAGNAVDRHRMGSDHEEPCPGRQQLGEEVREVFVQAATSRCRAVATSPACSAVRTPAWTDRSGTMPRWRAATSSRAAPPPSSSRSGHPRTRHPAGACAPASLDARAPGKTSRHHLIENSSGDSTGGPRTVCSASPSTDLLRACGRRTVPGSPAPRDCPRTRLSGRLFQVGG